jgi:L-serine dehydratase
MNYSVFEVFRIGIGPSSSHTVGPMSAVNRFLNELDTRHLVKKTVNVKVHLYGSLALTGVGHGTDTAVILGLMGEVPQTVDPAKVAPLIADIKDTQLLPLMGKHEIAFEYAKDIIFHHAKSLAEHPNGMLLEAFGAENALLHSNTYFSIGGGAVLDLAEISASKTQLKKVEKSKHPYAFSSATELLHLGQEKHLSIAEMVWQNELQYQDAAATREHLLAIWDVMNSSIERGLVAEGMLPGGLKVKRRAASLYRQSSVFGGKLTSDFQAMDMVSAFAIAVNEENACGGRVVTAPTNGSAGVIPAVLAYYTRFSRGSDAVKDDDIIKFLLTAAGIGMLYKKNASISAAEMGCQGEIGVSCSMAAAGLAAVLGATNAQIENAAEIAMEHNLGMTCDPIGGLVQVPCIERNSMGAVKAINAARLAMMDDGAHLVSLDAVIETMRQTGVDMQSKYRETALGGLAVNFVEC